MEKKIEICSNALLLLGHKPISSFDEPGAGALLAKQLWGSTYRNFLSINPWSFAKKYIILNRLVDKPSNPNWQYQFQLPYDLIRVNTTVPATDYDIFEDKLYSNNTELGLDYFYEIKEELLPPPAIKALEYNMAAVLATPLTLDATKLELYHKLYLQQLQTAMSTDAQGRPLPGFTSTPITDTRYN